MRADDSALARRTRERYEQVQALRGQGLGIKPIMRQTGLAKETVRRFYRAATAGELLDVGSRHDDLEGVGRTSADVATVKVMAVSVPVPGVSEPEVVVVGEAN